MPYSRKRSGRLIYFASYKKPDGKWTAEPAEKGGFPNTMDGAGKLERKRKDQVSGGSYSWSDANSRPTVDQWLSRWTKDRTARTKLDDERQLQRQLLSRHVLGRRFGSLYLDECTSKIVRRLLLEFFADRSLKLEPKTRLNAYASLRSMFSAAVVEEFLSGNPCLMRKGELPRIRRKPQRIYSRDEASAVLCHPTLEAVTWMAFAIMAFTGERLGEACGHRWIDWTSDSEPLGSLFLERQYNGAPIKGDTDIERPRMIPVHPELHRSLVWWRSVWTEVYGREPKPSDPIVANPVGLRHFTKSSSAKRFESRFKLAGILDQWKANHAMRRTFITQLRRAHPRQDIVERITHNARGNIVDVYTQWEWEPLCEVVSSLPISVSFPQTLLVSRSRTRLGPGKNYSIKRATFPNTAPGEAPQATRSSLRNVRQIRKSAPGGRPQNSPIEIEIGSSHGLVRGRNCSALALPLVLAELLLARAAANDITPEEFRDKALEWFKTRKAAA